MRTILVPFIFIFGLTSFASAQDERTPVTVLGLQSVDDDDRAAATITLAIRVAAGHREEWNVDERDSTLGQMMIAVDRTIINRESLSSIGRVLYPEQEGQIIFGRMRRLRNGSDEVSIELLLFDVTFDRVVYRMSTESTLSALISEGQVDTRAGEWLERLMSEESRFEDTGQPYFEEADSTSSATSVIEDASALEIAGVTLLGIAGAALITAIALGVSSLDLNGDPQFAAYRSTWDATRVGNVCDVATSDMTPEGRHAASVCSDASLFETLVPVFWVVAGASVIAGVGLVWHPWADREASVSLTPTLGPRRAVLDLRLTF